MDSRIAVACVVLAVFAVDRTVGAPQKDAVAVSGPAYTTKYDNIDVDQVLASKRLVNSYVQCLLDKKPCTPEGAELRKILPDALKTQCAKCNATQKNAALKVVDRLQKDYDAEWKQLLDKWDPKREHFQKFQQFLAEEKKKGFTKF
ncbi:ejaculatory bulb-specific protein 3-like [Aphis craccivora]|uniref:Ejaculatory bulb-specific protein 3-like n=1 Tax=Aphis craccivora TaxID=307492 RepID=A0A6G0Z9N0_APHCR|nr:ejaculatory bulb-specific protein 3-like [Aphis craccivora]